MDNDRRRSEAAGAASFEENVERQQRDAHVGRVRAEARATTAEAGRLRAERERNEANVDRVQAESDRDRAEAGRIRAEQGQAEMELLMGVLAHDLRNPLGAVAASAELLQHSGQFERASDRRTVDRIASAANRVVRLVEQLMDFARARSEQSLPMNRRPANLGTICAEVIEEIHQVHPEREVLLETSEKVAGWWDPDRLAQVADNLISNGLQHGARDAPIEVGVTADESTATLEVRNRGLAIDSETQESMFDPFRRTSDRMPGLGLGLYIVQQIVLAHGGTIRVDSSDVDGTVFRVQLPRAQPHESPIVEP